MEWTALAEREIGINTPEIVAWIPLADREISIGIPEVVGWVLLAEEHVSIGIPEVVGWVALAQESISLSITEVPGWVLLAEEEISLTSAPKYELIQHTIYHFAYIYDGDQEVTTATFRTDPFVPSAWLADKFASKLEEEVRARGGRPLEVKVYVDTSPLLWTDFRIEVSSTPIGGVTEAAPGIAVGIPVWLAIILVCLAITAVIVVATLAFKTIMAEFKKKPGLEEVKVAWGKEALILDIQDAEEYWERPPTPVETLEGMSEEELRDQLDQIAEEEIVPPEISPWAIIALVAGLGVLGVGAAVAFAARPKE